MNAQYAACREKLAISDSNFNLITHLFTFLVIYSFLCLFIPTTTPAVSYTFIGNVYFFVFEYVCIFAVSYFSGFSIHHDFFTFGKYPMLNQKFLVYPMKLACSLIFLHSLGKGNLLFCCTKHSGELFGVG